MPALILLNSIINFRGLELSTKLNRVNLEYSSELLDATTFGPGKTTRSRLKGLKNVIADVQGFYDTDRSVPGTTGAKRVDEELFAKISDLVTGQLTIGPNGNANGDIAYFFDVHSAEYVPGGSVGDIMGMSVSFQGNSDIVKGFYGLTGAYATGTHNGAAINAGAVSATQKLNFVCHLHALEGLAGRALTANLQSSVDAGFSSPVTRASFAFNSASIYDSYYSQVNGPITDTYWRVQLVPSNIIGNGVNVATAFGISGV